MDIAEAPLGRREKRKQEIRSRIEEAAYRLFREQGIEDTSIEQICVEADALASPTGKADPPFLQLPRVMSTVIASRLSSPWMSIGSIPRAAMLRTSFFIARWGTLDPGSGGAQSAPGGHCSAFAQWRQDAGGIAAVVAALRAHAADAAVQLWGCAALRSLPALHAPLLAPPPSPPGHPRWA